MTEDTIATLAFVLVIAAPIAYVIRKVLKESARIKAQNYEWYKSKYPQHVRRGRVECCHCGSPRIHTRTAGRTSVSEHYCSHCGVTLYFSMREL